MRLAGRAAAAVEILTEITERHRPASEALKDWGKAHRFAGSGDRHVIGTLVYDVLRRKLSSAAAAGSDSPRGLVIGTLKTVWDQSLDEISTLAEETHGIGALTAVEKTTLSQTPVMPPHVQANVPEWLWPEFERAYGAGAVAQANALADRAPIDLRVNTLKASRPQVLEALKKFAATEGPLSPWSVRIMPPGPDTRHANVEAEPAHGTGWYEVQDSASQVAAMLSGVKPGDTVADTCAGAGGKTLALAAMMKNQGKLLAYDSDKRRLRPIFERMTRAGVSCIEVIPADEPQKLDAAGGFDCVLIDAPCSGSGAWRRKPDSKWRLKPALLETRLKNQRAVLQRGASLVRSGGRLVYITCSVLPQENTEQVKLFVKENSAFSVVPYKTCWNEASPAPVSADGSTETLLLSPHTHGTDGFFVAVLVKR